MEKGLKPVRMNLKQALFHDTGANVIFSGIMVFSGIMKKKSSSSAEEDDL